MAATQTSGVLPVRRVREIVMLVGVDGQIKQRLQSPGFPP
jgi:hypothetical protein